MRDIKNYFRSAIKLADEGEKIFIDEMIGRISEHNSKVVEKDEKWLVGEYRRKYANKLREYRSLNKNTKIQIVQADAKRKTQKIRRSMHRVRGNLIGFDLEKDIIQPIIDEKNIDSDKLWLLLINILEYKEKYEELEMVERARDEGEKLGFEDYVNKWRI
jgi:hypothetical protein